MFNRSIVLFSGGLDSSTVLAVALTESTEVIALSFQYGQRHSIEQVLASKQVVHYQQRGMKVTRVEIPVGIGKWGASALTDKRMEMPKTGTPDGVIPVSYVPGRNTVFLSIAMGFAEAYDADAVYTGVNDQDYSGYPDCRPEYIDAMQQVYNLATRRGVEGNPTKILTPIIHAKKREILQLALEKHVPLELTWSCYDPQTSPAPNGGSFTVPCNLCDSCRIRNAAFADLELEDLRQLPLESH